MEGFKLIESPGNFQHRCVLGVLEPKGLFWHVRFGAGLENIRDVSRAPRWSEWPDPDRALDPGEQSPSLPLSPAALHPQPSYLGGAQSIATKGLCTPLRGEGAAHYHFNGSFHKYRRNKNSWWLLLLPASEKHYLGDRIGVLRGVTFLYIFIHAEQSESPCQGLPGALLYIRMHLHLHPHHFPTIELCGLFLFLVYRYFFFLKVGERRGGEKKKKHTTL